MSTENTTPYVTSHGPHRRSDGPGVTARVHVLHTGCSSIREALATAQRWALSGGAHDLAYYRRASSVSVALAAGTYAGEMWIAGPDAGNGVGYTAIEGDLPSGWRVR